MKIVNLGSLNVDHVYRVDHFLLPGETKASQSLTTNAGGKGLNQSVAASRTGVDVYHAGYYGTGSEILIDALNRAGVKLDLMEQKDMPTPSRTPPIQNCHTCPAKILTVTEAARHKKPAPTSFRAPNLPISAPKNKFTTAVAIYRKLSFNENKLRLIPSAWVMAPRYILLLLLQKPRPTKIITKQQPPARPISSSPVKSSVSPTKM